MTTELLGAPETIETTRDHRTDDGDHDRFAHYAPKDKLTDAMVFGTPVTALCGKKWVPSRDPQRYPVCPDCKDIYDNVLQPGDDEGKEG